MVKNQNVHDRRKTMTPYWRVVCVCEWVCVLDRLVLADRSIRVFRTINCTTPSYHNYSFDLLKPEQWTFNRPSVSHKHKGRFSFHGPADKHVGGTSEPWASLRWHEGNIQVWNQKPDFLDLMWLRNEAPVTKCVSIWMKRIFRTFSESELHYLAFWRAPLKVYKVSGSIIAIVSHGCSAVDAALTLNIKNQSSDQHITVTRDTGSDQEHNYHTCVIKASEFLLHYPQR